jgi:hypothetical protein
MGWRILRRESPGPFFTGSPDHGITYRSWDHAMNRVTGGELGSDAASPDRPFFDVMRPLECRTPPNPWGGVGGVSGRKGD